MLTQFLHAAVAVQPKSSPVKRRGSPTNGEASESPKRSKASCPPTTTTESEQTLPEVIDSDAVKPGFVRILHRMSVTLIYRFVYNVFIRCNNYMN